MKLLKKLFLIAFGLIGLNLSINLDAYNYHIINKTDYPIEVHLKGGIGIFKFTKKAVLKGKERKTIKVKGLQIGSCLTEYIVVGLSGPIKNKFFFTSSKSSPGWHVCGSFTITATENKFR
ncbi:MAG: hypothetical protein WDZ41_05460 [Candidatus Babeliales bacterium]